MSETIWKNHLNSPSAQPFNINGRKGKKRNAWWQKKSGT